MNLDCSSRHRSMPPRSDFVSVPHPRSTLPTQGAVMIRCCPTSTDRQIPAQAVLAMNFMLGRLHTAALDAGMKVPRPTSSSPNEFPTDPRQGNASCDSRAESSQKSPSSQPHKSVEPTRDLYGLSLITIATSTTKKIKPAGRIATQQRPANSSSL
jgi:hypothetical protein